MSDLAKQMYPAEWAEVETATGLKARRRRRSLRLKAEARAVTDKLRSEGKSCASCKSFEWIGGVGDTCLAESDFHGYQRASTTGICPKWSKK